jgi:hypothetical protein
MKELLCFLDIDDAARHDARIIWRLIEDVIEDAVTALYAQIQHLDTALRLDDGIVEHLKIQQKEHWRALFESRFDPDYSARASLIGIRHCEAGLDSRWYIAGYAKIKGDFTRVILLASLPFATKLACVETLNKYVALDMAMAASSYTSLLVE